MRERGKEARVDGDLNFTLHGFYTPQKLWNTFFLSLFFFANLKQELDGVSSIRPSIPAGLVQDRSTRKYIYEGRVLLETPLLPSCFPSQPKSGFWRIRSTTIGRFRISSSPGLEYLPCAFLCPR